MTALFLRKDAESRNQVDLVTAVQVKDRIPHSVGEDLQFTEGRRGVWIEAFAVGGLHCSDSACLPIQLVRSHEWKRQHPREEQSKWFGHVSTFLRAPISVVG
jgi:hypothetical protein